MTLLAGEQSAGEVPEDPGVRRPGRPRAEGYDQRILDAVTSLIDRELPVTVSSVVAESGVSRAALYRRWPRLTDLIASALDSGRVYHELDVSRGVKETLMQLLFGDVRGARGRTYTEQRFRKRLSLVMADSELQLAYWSSHARRRRLPLEQALACAVEQGELRADLDIEASVDAINGVFYYQAVVRGVPLDDPAALARCRAAFETIWRGMAA